MTTTLLELDPTTFPQGHLLLVPVLRQRGRPYPPCVARELLDERGYAIPAEKYPWCDRRGEFQWGDQHLCRGHAWKLATRRRVSGITPNGEWGGCLWHIDCEHAIDDHRWPIFSTYSSTKFRDAMKGLARCA